MNKSFKGCLIQFIIKVQYRLRKLGLQITSNNSTRVYDLFLHTTSYAHFLEFCAIIFKINQEFNSLVGTFYVVIYFVWKLVTSNRK